MDRKLLRTALALCTMLLIVPGAAPAQDTGRIAGRVVSAQTGAPVPAAQVAVEGAGIRATTDVEGRFTLPTVPAGAQTVTVQALGFGARTVTGVRVAAGGTAELNLSLDAEALALEGLTVTAAAERGSTAALLSERRRAATVVDAIGADQISRTPDGDAAAALRRVPGVSVVDGKYVYVRGLGERYGNTTLNGASLPSPIPDKKAVPLDIIPAGLLESIVTAKTYSPDQPGDYAGGLVQIETRAAPTARTLKISSSMGYTTGATLGEGWGATAGDLGFLGFGGGAFRLPAALPREQRAALPSDPAEREAFIRSLTSGSWGPEARDVPVSGSFGLSYGDELYLAGRPLGVVGALSYSSGFSQPEDRFERFFAIQGDEPAKQVDYRAESTAYEVTLGGLLNVGMQIDDTDRITATAVYNRLSENQARVLSGFYASQGPYLHQTRVQYTANALLSTQLRGEHLFEGVGDLGLKWRLAFSRAERDEPGTRSVIYRASEESAEFYFFNATESGLVLHQELADNGWNPGVDVRLSFALRGEPGTLSFGGSADVRDRTVYTRRIRLVPNTSIPDELGILPPDRLFSPGNIGTGSGQFGILESTFPGDNYDAAQRVYASYALVDAPILPRLRLVAGARIEQAQIGVAARDQFNMGRLDLPDADLDNTDVLPAVNLTYAVADQMNVRAAVSRTVARPQFRELAPYLFTDYFGGFPVIGNPFLERTSILNSDLRWEWFFGTGSLLSVSAFHKAFDRPIEPVALVLGTNPALTYANSEDAALYGAELEYRSNLGRLVPALENFSANLNLTLVRSRVHADSVAILNLDAADREAPLSVPASSRGRALFGQSPYTVNVGLTYARPGSTTATLLFNRFGRRLDAFGGQGLPDIHEGARTQLDLTVEQPLGRGFGLKLNAARLLGSRVEFTQEFPNGETVVTREYDLGRTFSLGIAWEPGT